MEHIKKRLFESSSIPALKESDRKRVWRFLKALGLQGLWIRGILKKRELKSRRYTLPLKDWLLENGFIEESKEGRKKILKRTEKGEDAFLQLDSYYSPSNSEGLRIIIDLGGEKQAKVTVGVKSSKGKEGLSVSEKVGALTYGRLFKRLLGFATFFAINARKDFKAEGLCIKVEPGEIDFDLFLLLVSLWEKYAEIVQEGRWGKAELLEGFYDSLRLTHLSGMDLYPYWKYWRNVEEEMRCKIKNGEGVNFDFLPFPRSDLEKSNVRSWIEKRLEEDPDWFMPHFIWVQLGFKQRKDLAKPSVANPPHFAKVGRSYRMVANLKRELDTAYGIRMKGNAESFPLGPVLYETLKKELGKPPDDIQLAFGFLIWSLSDYQSRSEFYDAWKIIRQEYEDFPEVSRILDAALLRYIYAGEKPDVDLNFVFEDLILRHYTSIEIAESIRSGGYKLKPADEERDKLAEHEKVMEKAKL